MNMKHFALVLACIFNAPNVFAQDYGQSSPPPQSMPQSTESIPSPVPQSPEMYSYPSDTTTIEGTNAMGEAETTIIDANGNLKIMDRSAVPQPVAPSMPSPPVEQVRPHSDSTSVVPPQSGGGQ